VAEALPVLIVMTVLLVSVFGSWWLAWRARKRRQALLTPRGMPVEPGALRSEHRVLYLATTLADAPLERIAVAGLGFRADAVVGVYDSGLLLTLAGRDHAVFIPVERMIGAGHANWTIDRGSGGDRIVFIRWTLGDGESAVEVDTNLRGIEPAALLAAIEALTEPVEIPRSELREGPESRQDRSIRGERP